MYNDRKGKERGSEMKMDREMNADALEEEIQQIFFSPRKTKTDRVLRGVCIAAAAVSFLSTITYLYLGKVIPGLSPFTLSVVLLLLARDIFKRQKEVGKKELFFVMMALVLLLACVLNLIAGAMQVFVYFTR